MNDFIKGMDLSTMLELEKCGAEYFCDGKKMELLDIMKQYDVDTIRLRLWNHPYSETGESYGAGENDLDTTLKIAKRVTEAGLGVLLNFQYSDFWADPGKQIKPKAWEGMSVPELTQAVYEYTEETMQAFMDQKINVTMVQVGNELTNGLLWPQGKVPEYDNIVAFLDAGIRGVKAIYPKMPIMIHLDNGGNCALYQEWFDQYFAHGGTDFDYIGLSYYPFWHGTLDMLTENMNRVAARYGKDMIVVEVSMGHTMEDYQSYEQLAPEERKGYATRPELVEKIEYPMTIQGQCDFMQDFMTRIRGIQGNHGKGFFYWEPAWIPMKGSGWATPASLKYMNDPGPCGNEWANQALFDYKGNALPALEVIRDFNH